MATIDECIEFALNNIGLWWRYGICRHCDEWKYIIIGRIFQSEITSIPPSLKISESSSDGSYRNTDEVWWRYGIRRSCDECPQYHQLNGSRDKLKQWFDDTTSMQNKIVTLTLFFYSVNSQWDSFTLSVGGQNSNYHKVQEGKSRNERNWDYF